MGCWPTTSTKPHRTHRSNSDFPPLISSSHRMAKRRTIDFHSPVETANLQPSKTNTVNSNSWCRGMLPLSFSLRHFPRRLRSILTHFVAKTYRCHFNIAGLVWIGQRIYQKVCVTDRPTFSCSLSLSIVWPAEFNNRFGCIIMSERSHLHSAVVRLRFRGDHNGPSRG